MNAPIVYSIACLFGLPSLLVGQNIDRDVRSLSVHAGIARYFEGDIRSGDDSRQQVRTNGPSGLSMGASYGEWITSTTRLLAGVVYESVPFSFGWYGDASVLGTWGVGNFSPTYLPLERWGVIGIDLQVQTFPIKLKRWRFGVSASLEFLKGSGRAGVITGAMTPDSLWYEEVRVTARFNEDRRTILGIRPALIAAFMLGNGTQLFLSCSSRFGQPKDLLEGEYRFQLPGNVLAEGQFNSSLQSIEFRMGTTFNWQKRTKRVINDMHRRSN